MTWIGNSSFRGCRVVVETDGLIELIKPIIFMKSQIDVHTIHRLGNHSLSCICFFRMCLHRGAITHRVVVSPLPVCRCRCARSYYTVECATLPDQTGTIGAHLPTECSQNYYISSPPLSLSHRGVHIRKRGTSKRGPDTPLCVAASRTCLNHVSRSRGCTDSAAHLWSCVPRLCGTSSR